MEQDIAIESVAESIMRRKHAPSSEPDPSAPLVDRFQSMHQKVADAAAATGSQGPSAPPGPGLTSWAGLRGPAMWAFAAAVLVGALAVWLRPALVVREAAAGEEEEEHGDERLMPLKVAGVSVAAGLAVGVASAFGGRK
jgi:hypothetical protein